MTNKDRAEAMRPILDTLYPNVKCSLNYATPVQMLIATQLSAQCTDAKVNKVTESLFKKYTDCLSFAEAELSELENDIRSIGLYRNKAKNIKLCCQMLLSDFGGKVPGTMDELLSLPGVGRKTANLVLGDIFGKPAIVVDTHCSRLANRIGLTSQTDPKKIEMDLKEIIPEDYQLRMCHQLVNHGRAVCSARSPKCGSSSLSDICEKNVVK